MFFGVFVHLSFLFGSSGLVWRSATMRKRVFSFAYGQIDTCVMIILMFLFGGWTSWRLHGACARSYLFANRSILHLCLSAMPVNRSTRAGLAEVPNANGRGGARRVLLPLFRYVRQDMWGQGWLAGWPTCVHPFSFLP